ncbi:GNAT family N-acetyltransferase [Candidatus Pelagibacter sp.]|nr:GNAT family N-acetyltransferase [Candidatus Pelagibacter sp.]
MQVKLRKVSIKDSDFLFFLRNEKSSRKNSFTTTIINKKDHKKWLEEELNNKGTIILVVYKNSERIGMVRYNSKDIFTHVSIGIEKKFRSLGYGAAALKASEIYLKKSTIVVAKVKKINKNSINMFLKNKFKIFLNKKYFILIKILRK